MTRILFVQRPYLVLSYPFMADRLRPRLRALGDLVEATITRGEPIGRHVDLSDIDLIAYYGGLLTEECLAAAPRLRAIATYTDNTGQGLPAAGLRARGIPVIDTQRAAAQSVAEVALVLTLSALRRIPMWHNTLAGREPMRDFFIDQFCDDPNFVNGTLGGKQVGIIGLGQIGGRVARFCTAIGASVVAYDPFISPEAAAAAGAELVDMDQLVARAQIAIVTVPPTPSARHLLDRERIFRLARGSLVVIATRAHAVDMAALRERIVANELAGAFDVYDVEPVPVDDPLRGRPNVVHTPHIAGRTVDYNTRTADMIAEDFGRVLRGEPPRHATSFEQMAVRSSIVDRPY